MRKVIVPKRIALASGDRLFAVDGNGIPSIGARLTALADLLPFLASERAVRWYHAVDVVVTSGNPLLAALALRGAAAAGLRASIALVSGDDAWPYDLASSDEVAHILASALRIEIPLSAAGSATEWILTRVLSGVPRDFPVISHHVSPGGCLAGQEGVFFLGEESAVWRPIDPHHDRLSMIFGQFMKARATLGAGIKGRTVVFARSLLLTSRPQTFGSSLVENGLISWADPVVGHGSARWDLPTYPDAAKAMVEDLIVLSRGIRDLVRTD